MNVIECKKREWKNSTIKQKHIVPIDKKAKKKKKKKKEEKIGKEKKATITKREGKKSSTWMADNSGENSCKRQETTVFTKLEKKSKKNVGKKRNE